MKILDWNRIAEYPICSTLLSILDTGCSQQNFTPDPVGGSKCPDPKNPKQTPLVVIWTMSLLQMHN